MCFRTRPIHSSNCTSDQFEINTEVLAPLKPRSYQHCDFTSCEEKRKAQVCSLSLFWVSLLLILVLTGSCSLSLFWVNLPIILVLGELAPYPCFGSTSRREVDAQECCTPWDRPSISLLDSGYFAACGMDFWNIFLHFVFLPCTSTSLFVL